MNRKLKRLQSRIDELYQEISKAKTDFKNLHGEKNNLLRQRESKENDKTSWQQRCIELQMLKFGREIDLDELEAYSDRTKEMEMENILETERDRFEKESTKLSKQVNQAKEKLMEVSYYVICFVYSALFCTYLGNEREHQVVGGGCKVDGFEDEDSP